MLHQRRIRNKSEESRTASIAPPPSPWPDPVWRPPAELDRYIPRDVRLSAAGRALFVLMIALIAGAILAGVLLSVQRQRGRERLAVLARDGVAATAEVIRVGRTTGDNKRWFLIYRYEVGQEIHQGRVTLRNRDSRRYRVGSALPLRYLPAEPGVSWVPGYEPGNVPLPVVIAAPAGLILFALLLARSLRNQRRLLSGGRVAEGRVTGFKKVNNGSHTRYAIEYEFRILSGALRKVAIERSKKPPQSGPATIVYDRENPRKIALYPLALVRVAPRA